MRKILVTGAAGFIGYHLARRLADQGHAVDLLDNHARGVRDAALSDLARRPNVRTIEADLTEPALAERLDTDYGLIVHLAAIIGVAQVRSRPYQVLTANVAMVQTALALARRQTDLGRFLFASTSEIYAGTLQAFGIPVPTPETTPLTAGDLSEPRTTYMLSKLYGEAMCRFSGVPFTIVRFHNVYGPRMGRSHVVPQLLEKAHRLPAGAALGVASAGHCRSFCYVDDAVEYLTRMAALPACAGEVFNIGTQEPELPIGAVARVILDAVGRDNPVEPLPDTPGSPNRRAPDMGKAIAATGYRSRIDLPDGVRRTYAWYRDHVFEAVEDCAL
ncbi:NAD-dependent epimerase/dehydratase family protein [Azospirillum doebereinerae]|uniref:NAD-dependent epimerase/dehydratase family protein n=1 Tax=Azospirillum doebereinerae TaxID=92933 RepID=UPI001EE5E462|nr:NAD-dependent epimerase/dehydratase family protein [Azospirillum doebereinerae]MCG5238768.1 NAD-dependent epimerase/dehydratase family protein [Azospirillum doebereinerae]